MFGNFGLYNPFTLHKSKNRIRGEVVYKLSKIQFILKGTVSSATLINVSGGTDSTLNIDVQTWDVNTNSFTASRISEGVIVIGQTYYIDIVVDGVNYYSDHIQFYDSDCFAVLTSFNTCNNINWNWPENNTGIPIEMHLAQQEVPNMTPEYETIITAQGEKRQLKRQSQRQVFWFIQPRGYSNLLDGIKINDNNFFGTDPILNIKNVDYEKEDINDFYSSFKVSFEYVDFEQGNDCCDDIDLDDIANPENTGTGGDCEGFTIEIVNTDDTLSVTLTDPPPTGTPTYKWYRNNLLISTATTIDIVQSGNYKVEVIQAGCKVTTSYFKDDVCGAMSLRVYSVGNFVNADLSNIPDGCTPTTSVTLNGIEVATSVPFEVSETGTYFVKVTACNCIKSGGVFINYSEESNCDFTLDINQTGNLLEADTDATAPTYLWELETSAGRSTIGTSISVTATTKGIYWLTVTEGTCSKETYVYLEPLASRGVFVRYGGTGTAFTIVGINLLGITDYAGTIKVTVNGVVFSYVAGSPSVNQYSVNISGQITVQSILTNPTIIVELI